MKTEREVENMVDIETEIKELIKESDLCCYDEDDDLIKSIRQHLVNIKNAIDDAYNLIELWYRNGCEFPFETYINVGGEEKFISFDNIRQMLFTVHLLE